MVAEKKGKFFYGWWVAGTCMLLVGCCMPLFVNTTGLYMLSVTQDLGISRGEFSLITTAFSLVGFIMAPVAGKILQKKNIRYITTAAIALASVAYASYGLVQAGWQLYICAAFVGFGYLFGANLNISVLMQQWFVKNRGTIMSVVFAGSGLGTFFFSPLITALIGSIGWRTTYMAIGLALLVILTPLSFIVIRTRPSDVGLKAYGEQDATPGKTLAFKIGFPLKTVIRTPEFWFYVIGFGLLVSISACQQHVPAYSVDIGYTVEQAAFFMSTYSIVMIVGKILMGMVFDRFGARAGIVMGGGGMIMCYLLLLAAPVGYAMLLCAAVFLGVGASLVTVFASVMTPLLFGDRFYSEILGVVAAVRTISNGLGSPLMGFAYDITGSYTPVWVACICVAIVGSAAMWISVPIAQRKLKTLREGETQLSC